MIQLKLNRVEHSFDGDAEMPLLWYLRDILGLSRCGAYQRIRAAIKAAATLEEGS